MGLDIKYDSNMGRSFLSEDLSSRCEDLEIFRFDVIFLLVCAIPAKFTPDKLRRQNVLRPWPELNTAITSEPITASMAYGLSG